LVSVLGYPLGADIFGPWITVNALVPLAIPAGTGAGLLYRWGREAIEADDGISAGIVTFLAILVVAQVIGTGVAAAYANPQSDDNGLVQYGQPADDLESTFRDIGAAAEGNQGADVLLYGESLYGPGLPSDPDKQLAIEPRCANLGSTLPIQWYLRTGSLTAACAPTEGGLEQRIAGSPPPAVIAPPDRASDVAARLPAYERRTVLISSSGRGLVVFVAPRAAPGR